MYVLVCGDAGYATMPVGDCRFRVYNLGTGKTLHMFELEKSHLWIGWNRPDDTVNDTTNSAIISNGCTKTASDKELYQHRWKCYEKQLKDIKSNPKPKWRHGGNY